VYTAKLVEEGGEGAYVTTVRLAESAAGDSAAVAAASFYIGEIKSDAGRNTNLFRYVPVLYLINQNNFFV
jgi:hypothetical protein